MDEATRQAFMERIKAVNAGLDKSAAERQEEIDRKIDDFAKKAATAGIGDSLKKHIAEFTECMETSTIDPMLAARLCNEKALQNGGKTKNR